jgi:cell division protein FtsL
MRSRTDSKRLHLNARLVRERDRARARELRWVLLGGAAIVIPLLVYVWQRVDFIQLSYRVEALKMQEKEQRELNEQLRVERSLLLAPDRIERLARRQLGLTEPPPQDVRRVVLIDGTIDELGQIADGHRGRTRRPFAAAGIYLPVDPGSEVRP